MVQEPGLKWRRAERVISIMSQTVVLTGMLVAAGVGVSEWLSAFSLVDWLISGSTFEERLEALESRPVHALGDLIKKTVNTAHLAETDGLLVVHSQGSGRVARFWLSAGPSGEMQQLTRGSAFEGATLPVRKGDLYMASLYGNGDPETIRAYWIPLE